MAGAEVHARFQACRADLGLRPLGLDPVCADVALSEDQRLILLTILAAAIAPRAGEMSSAASNSTSAPCRLQTWPRCLISRALAARWPLGPCSSPTHRLSGAGTSS